MADLSPEQVGLTLEEGHQLLQSIQKEIITAQAHAYELCRRPSADCSRCRHTKDVRKSACKRRLARMAFAADGSERVSAVCYQTNLGRIFRWARSTQCGRARKCGSFSQSSPPPAPRTSAAVQWDAPFLGALFGDEGIMGQSRRNRPLARRYVNGT